MVNWSTSERPAPQRGSYCFQPSVKGHDSDLSREIIISNQVLSQRFTAQGSSRTAAGKETWKKSIYNHIMSLELLLPWVESAFAWLTGRRLRSPGNCVTPSPIHRTSFMDTPNTFSLSKKYYENDFIHGNWKILNQNSNSNLVIKPLIFNFCSASPILGILELIQ